LNAYVGRGFAKFAVEDYVGAISDYNIAESLDSTQSIVYLNRGITKITFGLKDEGCTDLYRAHAMNDPDADRNIRRYCIPQ